MQRHHVMSRFAASRVRLATPIDVVAAALNREKRLRGDFETNPTMPVPADPRPAAVLVALVDRPDGMTILLTQRTHHLQHHAGQISFPGGRIEAGDASAVETALRECEEEVGLPQRHVAVIGRLDDYLTGTGFVVAPIVGLIEPPYPVKPDPNEVAEVFEVPLAFILDPANHKRHRRVFNGQERRFYAMPYGERYIWGATAAMLINLYEVLCD